MLTLSTKQHAYTNALDQLPMVQRSVADIVRKHFSSEFATTLLCINKQSFTVATSGIRFRMVGLGRICLRASSAQS
jgi:hypothetical protein